MTGFPNFKKTKRKLRESLNDNYYNFIQGTTDSEHAFTLFLNILGERIEDYSITDLCDAMESTTQYIVQLKHEAGIDTPSYLNFAVSDGYNIVASRYVTHPDFEPPSLYLSSGERIEVTDGKYHMAATRKHPGATIIASEPLTAERSDWHVVDRNHLIIITPELHIRQCPIE